MGKTTVVSNLATALARKGKRVLCVDWDPQANLSISMGWNPSGGAENLSQALTGARITPASVRKGLDLLPSSLQLATAEQTYGSGPDQWHVLEGILEAYGGYDFVIVDVPPSLGWFVLNALVACREVLIPCACDAYSLAAIPNILETVGSVKKRLNKGLKVLGFVPCRYDGRRVLDRDCVAALKAEFGRQVLSPIRECIAVSEASSGGLSIFEYRSVSHGSEDFARLAREVIRRKP